MSGGTNSMYTYTYGMKGLWKDLNQVSGKPIVGLSSVGGSWVVV
jgi:hypothetical protein